MTVDFHAKLDDLTRRGPGLYRKDLYVALGDDLRRVWGITEEYRHNPNGTYAIAQQKIEDLILTLGNGFEARDPDIVRVLFNVTIPDIQKMGTTKRLDWLGTAPKGYVTSVRTTAQARLKIILPHFAAQLQRQYDEQLQADRASTLLTRPQPRPNKTAPQQKSAEKSSFDLASRNGLFVGTVVAVVLIIAIGVGAVKLLERKSPMDQGRPLDATNSSVGASPISSAKTAGDFKDLQVSVVRITDGSWTWKAAFPASLAAAAQPFVAEQKNPTDPEAFLVKELDAGAYALGGMKLSLSFAGLRDQEITIYNVRPIVRREETPAGALLLVRKAVGGSDFNMFFDLDESTPVAKEMLEDEDGIRTRIGGDFFSKQSIFVKKNEAAGVLVGVKAERRAYSFDLEVSYVVGGEKRTIVVRRDNGGPFRVTPDPCGAAATSKVTYTDVRYNAHEAEANGWQMLQGSQANVCSLLYG